MLPGMRPDPSEPRLFQTAIHPCGYWPLRAARDLVIDPDDPRLGQLYPHGLAAGFRRSGDLLYRPHCGGCQACVPVRIDCAAFAPNRSQRRCLARNADLRTRILTPERSDERLALYQRYLGHRHVGGGMDDHGPDDYDRFLLSDWARSRCLEIRGEGDDGPDSLLAVAVTDMSPNGLSAVYTYFDPRQSRRALGTFAILQQILWARASGLPHLYLGYWIEGHAKMDYKRRFSGLQAYDGRQWQRLPPANAVSSGA